MLTVQSIDNNYPIEDLLALWSVPFPNLDARRVDWAYLSNPSGPARLFLFQSQGEGTLVGALTVFPRLFNVAGREVLGGTTGDFVVRMGHRSLGPALQLQRAAIGSNEFSLLLGFANEKAAPVQLRSGFRPLRQIDRFYVVLRSRGILSRRFPGRPFWLAGTLMDLFFRLAFGWRRLARRGWREFKPVRELDERADELWRQMMTRFDLVGRRDGAYLRWRYGLSPYKRYAFFGLEETISGTLLGLLAYRVDEDRIAWVDDFVFGDPGQFFKIVMPAFVDWAYQAGFDAVSLKIAKNEELAKWLSRAGFRKQATGASVLWHWKGDGEVNADLWSVCITMGDDDM